MIRKVFWFEGYVKDGVLVDNLGIVFFIVVIVLEKFDSFNKEKGF